jgi:hypothetical protein
MVERSLETKIERDPELEGFIESFQLSDNERSKLITSSSDPKVRGQIHEIWHYLEMRGEDCRSEAESLLRHLSKIIT